MNALTTSPSKPGGFFYALLVILLILALSAAPLLLHATSPLNDNVRMVTQQELAVAMGSIASYNPNATTNGIRFQTDVIRYLVKTAQERDRKAQVAARPLLIRHEDWYHVFLNLYSQGKEPPQYVRLAYENKQNIIVDYEESHVIRKVDAKRRPRLAANVMLCWLPEGEQSYSYEDTLSTPKLKVKHKRVITYRLLEFEDRVVCDSVNGLKGRPTTGLLSRLLPFESQMVDFRMAISEDERQIVRTKAKFAIFSKNMSMIVDRSGISSEDVPSTLGSLEKRLKQEVGVEYVKLHVDDQICRFR